MTDKIEVSTTKVEDTTTQVAKDKEVKAPIISKDKLLEAGTYFGHKKNLWNPKMKDYLYPQLKKGIHIINTQFTVQRLEFAYNLINKFVAKNPRAQFIFVGTKKQAKDTIKENALRTNSFYVTDRWLGGTLTNSSTIFSRVKTMEDLEAKAENNFEGYTKKEKLNFQKQLDKLHKNLDGIRKMRGLPTFMIVADPIEDEIAVKEARKKGVKVIGILDSNSNPDSVDFGIPANDDSAKSINLIITILADAIATARGGKAKYAYRPDSEIELPKFETDKPTVARQFERRTFVKSEESTTAAPKEVKGE
ncbi:30S ribosomal protein S2 [Mycoplasmopsis mucosicanis]|uniref:Small ribosomal subunit protein uS2 n=1 Tax=Mycoplasmopsis mucosicanis TaxID=458208 RepID=A0A507SN24_9BACT|nr:30S ribosomal protein S2 [Mycoplasmopsis mucosicanis]TQC51434.1 30S ribosomal protein S2 [Mycoplasmopsis mucosicanis]